jgi:Putative copper export protein
VLAFLYVALRWGHFLSLMIAFGCVLYAAWWATPPLRRLFVRRFSIVMRWSLCFSAFCATLMLMWQGGLMGNGWADVVEPDVWLTVLGTRFGSVWLWQILLAWISVAVLLLRPHGGMSLLLVLCAAQFLLMAGVGHAAMHVGMLGALQRTNHAIHLLCAGAWVGGLLPFLYCLQLANRRWRGAAIATMMRFSRYGHLAVAGVILSGLINAWLIQGKLFSETPYGELLLVKCALVALMIAIAVANRYVLVPRLAKDRHSVERLFLRTTQAELILGALVLAAVSLFATWEPF